MTRALRLVLLLAWASAPRAPAGARGAELPFTVTWKELTWDGVPGLQSFAIARARDGRWLCVGGRAAGLHGRNGVGQDGGPPANFEGLNDRLWVIDPAHKRVHSRPLTDFLAPSQAASLTVTSPEFLQVDDTLYIVGGYGFSADHGSMTTYPYLTAVDVSDVADAVVGGGRIDPKNIRRTGPDDDLAVAGGELERIGDTFLLVFGQSPRGVYTEATRVPYTYQVRPFCIRDDGRSVTIAKGRPAGTPAADPEFRRRDLNVVPAIRPDLRRGVTVYGGVFTPTSWRGSWMRPIDIDLAGDTPRVTPDAGGFRQRLCQYNCAALPIHRRSTGSMSTVFFGGISEVRYDAGRFRRDTNLPFVDLVSCVTREADRTSWEALVGSGPAGAPPTPLRMPGLLGTSARFVRDPAAPYDGGVLELDRLSGETVVGFIYGGIAADRANGGRTSASNRIFAVSVSPQPSAAIPVPDDPLLLPPRPSSQGPPR